METGQQARTKIVVTITIDGISGHGRDETRAERARGFNTGPAWVLNLGCQRDIAVDSPSALLWGKAGWHLMQRHACVAAANKQASQRASSQSC